MRIQHKILLSSAILASFTSLTPAMASYKPSVTPLSVYPGCEAPKAVAGAKTYYVDPVNGLDTNDGSQAKPWKTLSDVLTKRVATDNYKVILNAYTNGLPANPVLTAVNISGAVKPGDTIFLMSGNYGKLLVKGANKEFITVKAAPGQTPVIEKLDVYGANRWIFQGLKIQDTREATAALANLINHPHHGPVSNIIMDGNSFSSADNSRAWNATDWDTKAAFVALSLGGGDRSSCLAATNNLFTNVQRGAFVFSGKTLFAGNTIDGFGGGDALAFAANNLMLSQNFITNPISVGSLYHLDAIQGRINTADGLNPTYSNIVIDRNLIIRSTDPTRAIDVLQGIYTGNSSWNNMTITNNIIVTSLNNALAWGMMRGALIANNTVLSDDLDPKWRNATLRVYNDRPGQPYQSSENVVVRNNIAKILTVDMDIKNVVVENNAAQTIATENAGKTTYFRTAGKVFGGNQVVADLKGNFTKFLPATAEYDFNLQRTSAFVNSGTNIGAPAYDFMGRTRIAPFDLGAVELLPAAGVITVKANARQLGAPKIVVSVDGKVLGSAAVTANASVGQNALYSFNYNMPTKPKKVTVSVEGFGGTGNIYNSVGVFNVFYDPEGPANIDALRTAGLGKVESGNVQLLPTVGKYFTNGAVTFDVSGVN